MKRSYGREALLRTVGVICAVGVIVSGVTFAALQSQNAVLQGNSINSATASLKIDNGQGTYADEADGFNFANIEPGGSPMPSPGNSVNLKNDGSTNLALKISMNPENFANPGNAKTDRIFIILTPVDDGPMQDLSLSSLLAAYSNGSPLSLNMTLPAGQTVQYHLQVQIAGDAVTSIQTAVSLTGIDLVFSGTSLAS